MKDGFLKAAAFSPALRVADCTYNAQQILADVQAAAARGVKLAVFPEFCLTGYTCGDLFLQHTLQTGALDALQTVLDGTRTLDTVVLVGLPLLVHGKLYNCAAVLCRGQLLGLVPKTYLPNYGEFYEKRQFTPGSTEVETITVCGQQVPFGTSLLFRCRSMPSFVLGVELCEDLWSALPPSTFHALAGATVIANLSASDETVGKAEYRRALVSNQSARLLCGYLYASAGHGESTQDMVFAGHDLIAENGTLLAETAPFAGGIAETEIDCQRMEAERARNTSFELSRDGYTTVEFDLELTETPLTRWIDPAPFVPGDPKRRAERCELILKMQADGLAKRLEHAHAKTAVIGISGGLDSCLALLVAVRAMKQLGRPASDVLAVTMPCFGTTHRTRSNAEILCDELQVSFKEIDIAETVHSHFRDIGQDESVLDVTFENGQARVRTLELMDTANRTGGLVVGTGDLGSSFARLCRTLGARTSGVRRDPAKSAAGIECMYGFEALDTLLPAADVVALTLPQTPGTVRLFDKARLLRMKGDAILLNGGRGSCVDGQALAEVLADGRLWGAGLDVTDPEPLPPEHPLWRQPKALITPHTAGGNHLADTERRIARIALDNLRRYLAGEALRNRVR